MCAQYRKATCPHEKLSRYSMSAYPTLRFTDRRGVARLRSANPAKITVLMYEQKPYSVLTRPQSSLIISMRQLRDDWGRVSIRYDKSIL